MESHKMDKRQEVLIKDVFLAAVAFKIIGAITELVLGLMLVFTDSAVQFVLDLVRNQLLDDPDNFFTTHVRAFLMPSHDAQVFGGIYLLVHGVVKLFLFINLWRGKLWAYPATIAIVSLFIMYEILRGVRHHSLIFLWFTVFDVLLVWLIVHEYRLKRRSMRGGEQSADE